MEQIRRIEINGKDYEIKGDSVFIRYSANADGTGFTETWSEGQNYMGFASGLEAPTRNTDYTWVNMGYGNIEQYVQEYVPKVATRNLADLTFENASIDTAHGTFTARTTGVNYSASEEYIAVTGGESYTLSWVQNDVWSQMYIHEYKADKTFIKNTNAGTHNKNFLTVTTDDECAFIRVHFYSFEDTPWSDLVPDKLQIELGTEATKYVVPTIIDYKIIDLNGHPDMADVVRQQDMEGAMGGYVPKIPSRNLADLTFKDAEINDNTGVMQNGNGVNYSASEEYIAVTGGEYYTLSWAFYGGTSWLHIHQYNANKEFIGKHSKNGIAVYKNEPTVVQLAENCAYIRIRFYSYTTDQVWSDLVPDKLQIELGCVATPYIKPYVVDTDELDVESINSKGIDYVAYGLPVLEFNGDITGMNKDNSVTLAYTYGDRTGSCTLKWQGNSSLKYPKKNYTVKFDNAFEAKEGWGKQKKYCLKANYIDFTHSRNIGCAKLWGGVVKSRTPANATLNALPNAGAIDGFPICVVINGEHKGLYTFNIPKDGWMFGMGSGTQEAILCAENAQDGRSTFRAEALLDESDWSIEYQSDGFTDDAVRTSFNRLVRACINSDGTDLDTTIAQYLDWESAIDYYVHCLISLNYDGLSKNCLMVTYDGIKWFFSAYDMDSTFGLSWDGSGFIKATSGDINHPTTHRIFELIKTYKADRLKARYKELVNGALSEETIIETFANFVGSIPKALLDEEVKIWTTLPSTSVNNVSQIIDFNRRRRAYIDPQIESL